MGLYMLFLAAGIVLGMADKIPSMLLTRSSGFQSWSLIIILFAMGVGIGSSSEITGSFYSIGMHSVAFAVAAIIGSIATVRLFRPLIKRGGEDTP